jgi:hypothetical protein
MRPMIYDFRDLKKSNERKSCLLLLALSFFPFHCDEHEWFAIGQILSFLQPELNLHLFQLPRYFSHSIPAMLSDLRASIDLLQGVFDSPIKSFPGASWSGSSPDRWLISVGIILPSIPVWIDC